MIFIFLIISEKSLESESEWTPAGGEVEGISWFPPFQLKLFCWEVMTGGAGEAKTCLAVICPVD